MRADEIIAILERAEQLITPRTVSTAYDDLAKSLDSEIAGLRPVLVSVLNGGLIFASELIHRFDFPLELDTIRVSRYHGVSGKELQWHVKPAASIEGRHVVLLDDVIDLGITLACIKEELLKENPASIRTAVLIRKTIDNPSSTADLVGLDMPDRFLVGEGMDFEGYGRNKKGIWALRQEDEAAISAASA